MNRTAGFHRLATALACAVLLGACSDVPTGPGETAASGTPARGRPSYGCVASQFQANVSASDSKETQACPVGGVTVTVPQGRAPTVGGIATGGLPTKPDADPKGGGGGGGGAGPHSGPTPVRDDDAFSRGPMVWIACVLSTALSVYSLNQLAPLAVDLYDAVGEYDRVTRILQMDPLSHELRVLYQERQRDARKRVLDLFGQLDRDVKIGVGALLVAGTACAPSMLLPTP